VYFYRLEYSEGDTDVSILLAHNKKFSDQEFREIVMSLVPASVVRVLKGKKAVAVSCDELSDYLREGLANKGFYMPESISHVNLGEGATGLRPDPVYESYCSRTYPSDCPGFVNRIAWILKSTCKK
jgi:hypothetical protein